MTTDCRTFRQLGLVNCIQYTVDEDLRTWLKHSAIICYRLIDSAMYVLIKIYWPDVTTKQWASTISLKMGWQGLASRAAENVPPPISSSKVSIIRTNQSYCTYTRVIKNWLLHACVCIRHHTWQDVYLGVHPMTMASPRYHHILMYFGQSCKMAAKTTDWGPWTGLFRHGKHPLCVDACLPQ